MSIINDALKKTQKNIEYQHKELPSPSLIPKRTIHSKLIPIIVVCVLVSIGIWAGLFIAQPQMITRTDKTSPETVMTPLSVHQRSGSAMKALASDTDQKKWTDPQSQRLGLRLNGIVQTRDGYVALINNKIVKEGENVGDKEIVSISIDHVKISDQGEILILKR